MPKNKHKAPTARPAIPRLSVEPEGVRVDISQFPPPTRTYDADVAWVTVRYGAVSLFFAKTEPYAQRLRTRLEIRYPIESLRAQFVENTSGEFFEKLCTFLTRHALAWPAIDRLNAFNPSEWPAERDHSEWVNYEYLAHSGSIAVLDFYRLDPTGVPIQASGKGSSRLTLEPVIRILTTADVMRRVIEESRQIVGRASTPTISPTVRVNE
jgi:hypothetical protein